MDELGAPVGVVDVAELVPHGLERRPRLVDATALERDACGVQRGADDGGGLDGPRLRREHDLGDQPERIAGVRVVGAHDDARPDERDRHQPGRGPEQVGASATRLPPGDRDGLGVLVLQQRSPGGRRPDRGEGLVLVVRLGRGGGAQLNGDGSPDGVQKRFGADVGDPAREEGDQLAFDVVGIPGPGRRRHQPGGQRLDEVVVGAHGSEVERQLGVLGRPSGLVADVARAHDLSLRPVWFFFALLGSLQHRTMFLPTRTSQTSSASRSRSSTADHAASRRRDVNRRGAPVSGSVNASSVASSCSGAR